MTIENTNPEGLKEATEASDIGTADFSFNNVIKAKERNRKNFKKERKKYKN